MESATLVWHQASYGHIGYTELAGGRCTGVYATIVMSMWMGPGIGDHCRVVFHNDPGSYIEFDSVAAAKLHVESVYALEVV